LKEPRLSRGSFVFRRRRVRRNWAILADFDAFRLTPNLTLALTSSNFPEVGMQLWRPTTSAIRTRRAIAGSVSDGCGISHTHLRAPCEGIGTDQEGDGSDPADVNPAPIVPLSWRMSIHKSTSSK